MKTKKTKGPLIKMVTTENFWGCLQVFILWRLAGMPSIYKHYNLQHNSEMPERFIEKIHIISRNVAANLGPFHTTREEF